MPTYDLLCCECEHVWEIIRTIVNRDKLEDCPKCGSVDVSRYYGNAAHTNVFEKRFFEHLSPEGVFIESKKQLKEECLARGFDPQKVPALN